MAIFLCCSGLGLGNATRSFAIAEELREQNPEQEIHIFSWGRALDFWKSQSTLEGLRIHEMSGYVGTVGLKNIFSYFSNTFRLWRARRLFAPQLVLLDSDYHFGAFFLRRFPLYFLGQAYDVLSRAKRVGFKSRNFKEGLTFLFREKFDFYAQYLFCDYILVPTFAPSAGRAQGKIRPVALIVRKFFLKAAPPASEEISYAVVASGSGWGRKQLANVASSLREDLRIPPVHHEISETMRTGTVVLTQGGLSSISECVALNKFCVCAPLEGHPEQEINARTLELLGLGIALRDSRPENSSRVRTQFEAFRANAARERILCDGAQQIGRLMLSELQHAPKSQDKGNLCLHPGL